MKEKIDYLIKNNNIDRDIVSVYNYLNNVVDYGHIALFSGIIDIDLESVKKGLKELKLTDIIEVLDKAVSLNKKLDESESLELKMEFSNIYSSFKELNEYIIQKIDKIYEIIINYIEYYPLLNK